MTVLNIDDYIKPGRRAHLVGVGGVSMSPLAEVLHGAGMVITGSDMHDSATVEHLRSLGIHVTVGHRAENVAGAELVIRTAAVHDVNPEIAAARETNDIGISSRDLAEQIPGAEYYATLPEVTARLRELARPGDLILTVGAGDIYTAGEALVRGE